MRGMFIAVTAASLLSAAGCHHACNCGGDGVVADMGHSETLAGVVAGRNWQPAFATPPAPLGESATSQMTSESEARPQPRRMPTGAPTVTDVEPAQ